jgi:hypothetical protein
MASVLVAGTRSSLPGTGDRPHQWGQRLAAAHHAIHRSAAPPGSARFARRGARPDMPGNGERAAGPYRAGRRPPAACGRRLPRSRRRLVGSARCGCRSALVAHLAPASLTPSQCRRIYVKRSLDSLAMSIAAGPAASFPDVMLVSRQASGSRGPQGGRREQDVG